MSKYGVLMSFLLQQRSAYRTEDEFRRFLTDSVSELSRELRDFDIEISIRPAVLNARPRSGRDWNSLHIGCE